MSKFWAMGDRKVGVLSRMIFKFKGKGNFVITLTRFWYVGFKSEDGEGGKVVRCTFQKRLVSNCYYCRNRRYTSAPFSTLSSSKFASSFQTPRQAECNPRRLMENVRSVPYKGPDGTFDGLTEKGDCESKS